jgi:hypothetical protein
VPRVFSISAIAPQSGVGQCHCVRAVARSGGDRWEGDARKTTGRSARTSRRTARGGSSESGGPRKRRPRTTPPLGPHKATWRATVGTTSGPRPGAALGSPMPRLKTTRIVVKSSPQRERHRAIRSGAGGSRHLERSPWRRLELARPLQRFWRGVIGHSVQSPDLARCSIEFGSRWRLSSRIRRRPK